MSHITTLLYYIHERSLMYINKITTKVEGMMKYLRGVSSLAKTRTTMYGEYNGVHIAIDFFKDDEGRLLQKRYVLWNNEIQLEWYKNKKADGKFEVLG